MRDVVTMWRRLSLAECVRRLCQWNNTEGMANNGRYSTTTNQYKARNVWILLEMYYLIPRINQSEILIFTVGVVIEIFSMISHELVWRLRRILIFTFPKVELFRSKWNVDCTYRHTSFCGNVRFIRSNDLCWIYVILTLWWLHVTCRHSNMYHCVHFHGCTTLV